MCIFDFQRMNSGITSGVVILFCYAEGTLLGVDYKILIRDKWGLCHHGACHLL